MPVSVVRNLGRSRQATLPNGRVVERQDTLTLRDGVHACLPTDNHFVYTTTHIGSAMMCTCGAPAIIVGYHAYKQYSSYIGNEVIMCQAYAMQGKHADGSS